MKNRLFYGDCLDVLKNSIEDESIDLIYIDPPFNSKRNYNVLFESIDITDAKAQKEAFADTWSNVKYRDELAEIQDRRLDLYQYLNTLDSLNVSKGAVSYLTTMALRILFMHRKLKQTGSFYLHCDASMSHYLKVVTDLIFDSRNFINSIVWSYHRWTSRYMGFQSTHDDILFYAKEYGANKFHELTESYSSKSKHPKRRVSHFEEGKIKQRYTDNSSRLKSMRDVWEISYLNSQAKERLGYPTQKPEALLERIIKASSDEGDVVADFFCGCGTAVAVAHRLNRRWVGVDISHLAVRLIHNRLIEPYRNSPDQLRELKDSIEINGFPRDAASAHELATANKKGRIKFQDWIIEIMLDGVSNPKKVADEGYDGYITLQRDAKNKDVVLIEVKSGGATIRDVRAFAKVIDHEKAVMGVFVCFGDHLTKGMQIEANNAGYYDQDAFGTRFPRIQILTVEELLEGKTFSHPHPAVFNVTFKKAGR